MITEYSDAVTARITARNQVMVLDAIDEQGTADE